MSSLVTIQQSAVSNQQLGLPEDVASYAGVLAGSDAPLQHSGSFKSTASCSDMHVPAVSTETSDTRMSNNMFGPLSDKPDDNTPIAIVANTCLQAGQSTNKAPIFLIGISDAHNSLSWLLASFPGGPMAQLKSENLMGFPRTANRLIATIGALRSLDVGYCELPHIYASVGPLQHLLVKKLCS
jgi:hypothetical protein